MFRILFYSPRIAPNTCNAIRMVAATGCELHLVQPLGFDLSEPKLRRAGLDYHEYAQVQRHASWAEFQASERPDPARCFALTTRGQRGVHEVAFQPGDWLVFGSETQGLPPDLREQFATDQRLRLPMRAEQRSLNLSNAVAVVVFEAWRQQGFAGAGR